MYDREINIHTKGSEKGEELNSLFIQHILFFFTSTLIIRSLVLDRLSFHLELLYSFFFAFYSSNSMPTVK